MGRAGDCEATERTPGRRATERKNSTLPTWSPSIYYAGIPRNCPNASHRSQLGMTGTTNVLGGKKARLGTTRNSRRGIYSRIPPWNPPNLGAIAPNSIILHCPVAPSSTPIAQRRGIAIIPNGRGGAEQRGALRGSKERLNMRIPLWRPPYFRPFSPNRLIHRGRNVPLPGALLGRDGVPSSLTFSTPHTTS